MIPSVEIKRAEGYVSRAAKVLREAGLREQAQVLERMVLDLKNIQAG